MFFHILWQNVKNWTVCSGEFRTSKIWHFHVKIWGMVWYTILYRISFTSGRGIISFGQCTHFCWLAMTCIDFGRASNSYASRRKFFTVWPPNASRHKLIASQLYEITTSCDLRELRIRWASGFSLKGSYKPFSTTTTTTTTQHNNNNNNSSSNNSVHSFI